jgi:hypothetical protein
MINEKTVVQLYRQQYSKPVFSWRDVRVADGDGLENRCRLKPTEGSNPSLSAIYKLDKSRL